MAEALDELRALAAGREQARTEEVAGLLQQALSQEWDKRTTEALESALDVVRSGSGEITSEDIQEVIGTLRPFLKGQMQRAVSGTVGTAVEANYMIGQEGISIEAAASLNVTDRRVMNFLQENTTFWVGNHYEQQVQDRIRDAAEEVLENADGVLGRRKAAQKFREAFSGQFQKSESYWQLLSNDVSTKSREFGRVEGMVKAELEVYMIDAVLDSRTSAICNELNNREFEVRRAVEQRDKMVEASDPEAVKDVSPWPREKKTDDGETVATLGGDRLDALSNAELANRGVLVPPFHGNCRSRIVAVR